jgi:DNA-directed RNA polymerase subunit RPC12/RpoP
MAGVPIKFRCFECHKLLGAPRSKAGAEIVCPKCSARLIVPEADSEAPMTAPAVAIPSRVERPADAPQLPISVTITSPPPAAPGDQGISLDLLEIRPEDIRVEPGLRPRPPAPSAASARAAAAPPVSAEPPTEIDPGPLILEVEETEPARSPSPGQSATVVTTPRPPRPDPVAPAPAIAIAPATPMGLPARSTAASPRARDLLIPRSVVGAWSLFVLLALAMSFLAGLLAGHYVWRVH